MTSNNRTMSNSSAKIAALMCIIICVFICCKKQDQFLDVKRNQSLLVPLTLSDFRAFLSNEDVFNLNDPDINIISGDEFYMNDAGYINGNAQLTLNAYTWAKDIYNGYSTMQLWNILYKQVYYSNIVLDGLHKLNVLDNSQQQLNETKGIALFYRSKAFYNIGDIFAPVYDSSLATSNLGIPLRLTADPNPTSTRANSEDSYNQICTDLKTAIDLLPNISAYKTSPTKQAAYGLLARIYLSMRKYSDALFYADLAIGVSPDLLDYNQFDTTASAPFTIFNKEDIFHSVTQNTISRKNIIIDSTLYKSYDDADLRKHLFFAWNPVLRIASFRQTYDYANIKYAGVATDEMYLIKAECVARSGNLTSALAPLNTLLQKRYKTGLFTPISLATQSDVLNRILLERRKELFFRGLRWSDLRRLNKDPNTAITLTRTALGNTYTLPANDLRYTFPIPPDVIAATGMPQNQR